MVWGEMDVMIIGVGGGSGAGKTFLVHQLQKQIDLAIIAQEWYYWDWQDLPKLNGFKNLDHPDSFDTSLLIKHLQQLKSNRLIEIPRYQNHTRSGVITLHPQPVIFVVGITVLWSVEIRKLCDLKIYVDTPADIRLIRRLEKAEREWGLSTDMALRQYENVVFTMDHQFVQPTRQFADVIVFGNRSIKKFVELIANFVALKGNV